MTSNQPTQTNQTRFYKVAKFLAVKHNNGELAAARRIHPDKLDSPVFWMLITRFVEPEQGGRRVPLSSDELGRWATIIATLARLIPFHETPVKHSKHLGTVLAEADVHEQRVLRLLRAHGIQMFDTLMPLAHLLVSKGRQVNWWGAAELVLSDGRPHEEQVRQRVARDFYASLSTK